MSFEGVTPPTHQLTCDAAGANCPNTFTYTNWLSGHATWLRHHAAANGWLVRPASGAGARSAPDLCPDHSPAVTS